MINAISISFHGKQHVNINEIPILNKCSLSLLLPFSLSPISFPLSLSLPSALFLPVLSHTILSLLPSLLTPCSFYLRFQVQPHLGVINNGWSTYNNSFVFQNSAKFFDLFHRLCHVLYRKGLPTIFFEKRPEFRVNIRFHFHRKRWHSGVFCISDNYFF